MTKPALDVLHVQKVKGIGGSERHLLSLLTGLRDADVSAAMLVLAADGAERFVAEAERRGIRTLCIPARESDMDPRTVTDIGRVLRRERPALVHTHLVHASVHGLSAARTLNVPAVATSHNVDPRWGVPPVRTAAALSYRWPRRVIAISEFVRRFHLDHRLSDPDRTVVVHYGIDAERFDPSAGTEGLRSERRSLGIDPGAFVASIIARAIPGKGFEVLFAAVARLRERIPTLHVLVAGDGPLLDELRRCAQGLPVTFLGFCDDIRPVLWASDVLVFPTSAGLGEGFGMSALEAMAARVPVIASDVGALPEVVNDGVSGRIVPSGSVRDLIDAFAGLADDPAGRQAMGQRASEQAASRFSLDRMVARTISIYEEVR